MPSLRTAKFWDRLPRTRKSPTGLSSPPLHEVLKMTPSIKELIMKDATADAIEVQAKKEGMLTMLEDGIYKCAAGLTTIEEVLRVITE